MLDAMTPGCRYGPTARRRFARFTYVPNGITMADWTPKGPAAFELRAC